MSEHYSDRLYFKEPVKGFELALKRVRVSALEVPSYQRNLRPTNISRLKQSIEFTGFWSIPIVIELEVEKRYLVIDGQHRLEALKERLKALGKSPEETYIYVLIVPQHFRDIPLHFNLEEKDNLKDKAIKLYELYQEKLDENPELLEEKLYQACLFQPYLFAIAFSYEEEGLGSGSLVESFAKKFMGSIYNTPLSEAAEIRREQAKALKNLESLINKIAEQYSIKDYFLKQAILSKTISDLWGRKRNIDEDWEQAFAQVIQRMTEKDWSFLSS